MRAWRCSPLSRVVRDLGSSRSLVAILVLVAALASPLSLAWGQTKTTTKSGTKVDTTRTDESGFNVRVREATSARIQAKVDKAIAKARRDAQDGKVVPPEPPDTPDEADAPDVPEPPDFDRSEGNDLVRFGEDITISEGRVIEGDVVAVGGSITVLGRVKGDAVSVGGTVSVKGKGVVEGDAVSLGGGVSTSDSASVGGSDVSVGKFDFQHMNHMWPLMGGIAVLGTGAKILKLFIGFLITLLIAWVSLVLFRDRIENAATIVHQQLGRSFLMGLLGWVLLVLAIPVGIIALILTGVIAIVILCITIIGIPVAILLVVALVLGLIGIVVGAIYVGFLGYLTGALFLGRRVFGSRVGPKPLMAVAAGILLVSGLSLLGELIGALSFFFMHPVGMAFGFAAGLLGFIVTTAGLGALITGRFGRGAVHVSYSVGGSQWGSTPPPSSPPPPPPTGPTQAPPPPGSSDAP